MTLYKVPLLFESELYVEADDEDEAQDIAAAVVFADENNAYDPQPGCPVEVTKPGMLEHVAEFEHVYTRQGVL